MPARVGQRQQAPPLILGIRHLRHDARVQQLAPQLHHHGMRLPDLRGQAP
jgi:hypothetical protein